jgi:hypothetical protein
MMTWLFKKCSVKLPTSRECPFHRLPGKPGPAGKHPRQNLGKLHPISTAVEMKNCL